MATRGNTGLCGIGRMEMQIRWDADIEEYVGRDLDDIEHFGQSWSECAARISEANETIVKHRMAQGFQRCPICGEPEFPGHFEQCAYEF